MQDIEKILGEVLPEINFLKISNPKIVPGSLIESPEIDQWIGNIQDVLGDYFEEGEFETEVAPAAFNLRSAHHSFKSDAAINVLALFGLNVKRQAQFRINIEIAQVKVRQFKSSRMSAIQLEQVFQRLRDEDKNIFRSLRGRFLVFSSFYASQLRLQFSELAGTGLDLRTDLEKVDAGIDLSVEQDVLFVNKNDTVPFGVFGYEITKTGTILETP